MDRLFADHLNLIPCKMSRPSYQPFSIRRLNEMYVNKTLDLDPEWQRGSVWTASQKPKLIDSLDTGIPVPHLVMWARPHGKFVMVDGKQRTETVISFINDGFPTDDEKKDFFSERSPNAKEDFLDTELYALVFPSRTDEDFIVEYFERINSGSKQLSNGELINALCSKPIVNTVNALFFTHGTFQIEWSNVFGPITLDNKRMSHYADSIPYFTSSMFGIEYLTKSYPVLARILKETDQQKVQQHITIFAKRVSRFREIVNQTMSDNPWIQPVWKKGLPPLRQMSPIWMTVLEPQRINGKDPIIFWSSFYNHLQNNQDKLNEWKLFMRKNGKMAQITKDIQYAIMVVDS